MNISIRKLLDIKNKVIKQGYWNQYHNLYSEGRKNQDKNAEYSYYKLIQACGFEQKYMDELLEHIRQIEQNDKLRKENLIRNGYYFDSFRKWVESMLDMEFNITDKLAEKKLQNVAIYGAGRHGRLLLKYLNSNRVNVCCFIDKNTSLQDVEGVPVYGLKDEVRGVDLIVVTPYGSIEEIRRELKTNCVMMALNEFFDIKTWGQANGKD